MGYCQIRQGLNQDCNMNFKKIIFLGFFIFIFTCLGFFCLMCGGTEYEYTREINVFLVLARIFLWPLYLWNAISSLFFPSIKSNNYLTIGLCQIIGYFFIFFVLDKIKKNYKK
jgi:hypothetical protein